MAPRYHFCYFYFEKLIFDRIEICAFINNEKIACMQDSAYTNGFASIGTGWNCIFKYTIYCTIVTFFDNVYMPNLIHLAWRELQAAVALATKLR